MTDVARAAAFYREHLGFQIVTLWMRVQRAGGALANGGRLFSPETARQLTTIVTTLPLPDLPAELPQLKVNFSSGGPGRVRGTSRRRNT